MGTNELINLNNFIIFVKGTYIQQRIMEDESGITIGQTAPTWVKDDNVSMCMLCAFKFGFINRKHHCRGCGRVTQILLFYLMNFCIE